MDNKFKIYSDCRQTPKFRVLFAVLRLKNESYKSIIVISH